MLNHASWINGNAVVLEEPNNILVRHWGRGTEMQFSFAPGVAPRGTWCHIALPTPVIVNDIHIYDGPGKIAAWDAIPGGNTSARRSGDHSRSIDDQKTIMLPAPHEVSCGLSISFTFRPLAVNTSLQTVDPEGKLLISAAGADFI
ncbi:MAG: hypothetical protein HGA62_03385 [Chlorobiaceae bacterium]|nr:hypothetical protein [Chlorobiaceae bacterium]NTV60079.1 hypothetical protein [Chlorobiaceae bacterium]